MEPNQKHDDSRGMLIAGVIVLGVGLLFLLQNLEIIPNFDVVWPVFPIIVGLALIVGAVVRMGRSART